MKITLETVGGKTQCQPVVYDDWTFDKARGRLTHEPTSAEFELIETEGGNPACRVLHRGSAGADIVEIGRMALGWHRVFGNF